MQSKQFIEITDSFKDRMYRLSKRLLVSADEAQDATQEVLLKLWLNRKQMQEYRNPEAYAITMTKNYCYDKLKAKSSSNLKIVHSNYEDTSRQVEKQIEAKDAVGLVFEMMKALPEQQRLILHLRDVEQYDNAEIAKQLEMNETAVRVALSRARKTIREQLIKKHNYGIK